MDFEKMRQEMLDEQLIARGVSDPRVIGAMRRIPRHLFVPPAQRDRAYQDNPIAIGEGQTISQPYMVGLMTQSLDVKSTDRVLEIGTGSGYQAAILAVLAAEVTTVERHKNLQDKARKVLSELGIGNVCFIVGDGTDLIRDEERTFDAIMVTAGAPQEPGPLLDHLSDGGRLLAPVGPRETQVLMLFTKKGQTFTRKEICRCVFVPLIGKHGWHEDDYRRY